jgi:hypothetical protein
MPAQYDAEQLKRRFDIVNERLRGIEGQLELLSEKAGVPYSPPSEDVPAEVVQLAEAGKTLEAIKRYRELTNAPYEQARDLVMAL